MVKKNFLTIRELTILAIGAALMVALQVAMAALPNIEPVSLLIIVLTFALGWKALLSVAVFILLEGILYGFGLWWFFYLYAWPLLTVAVMLLKKTIGRSGPGYAVLSGLFGLLFGFLYALILFFTGGTFQTVLAAWVAGIPFDVLHCLGNFFLCLFLFRPLTGIIEKFCN